jgi:signal transduction histidine kinase
MPKTFPVIPANRAWFITLGVIYICYAAVVLRTLARADIQARLPVYLGMELIYLLLYTLMLWHPIPWKPGQYLYFIFQTLLVLTLLLLNPKFDFVAVLFVLLAFEAALVFPKQVLFWWVAVLILLPFITLTTSQGWYGLALSLTPIAACIIFSAYVLVNQEMEKGLSTSKVLVDKLQEANRQLTAYASQVEEFSIIQERNRLARELHDSVYQAIQSIVQLNRDASLALEHDPDHLGSQLDQLQKLTQSSLEQMRRLIASLHPPDNGSAERLTPDS